MDPVKDLFHQRSCPRSPWRVPSGVTGDGRHERFHIASASVHGILYIALVCMAVTGWLGTGASGFPVQFFDWNLPKILAKDKELGGVLLYTVHGIFGYIITLCVFLHIGGALKHWLVNRDGVIGRMSLP